jgi:hypothetical protein
MTSTENIKVQSVTAHVMTAMHDKFFPTKYILDIQGLQSPASRIGLSSPLDLAKANSAPGHYSRYWAYTKMYTAQIIICKIVVFLQ